MYKEKIPDKHVMMIIIQIKIAMSKDKLRILINILAESHMVFDLGDKIDNRWHRLTDQPYSISSSF